MSDKDVYLIHLTGQGDVEVAFVNKEVFDWINSTDKGQAPADRGKSGWYDQTVPKFVSDRLPSDERGVFLTIGSFNNDRALAVIGLKNVRSFTSVRDAMAHVRRHNLNVVNEFEGSIY